MKKNFFLIAAAVLTLGMTACTDEYVEIIDNGDIVDVPTIKSTADLVGTEWNYTPEDIVFVDEMGDTLAMVPMSGMTYTLSFDAAAAHLAFPENVTMISLVESAGEYTLEEIAGMNFDYVYDLATTSGTLSAQGTDAMGEPLDFHIEFSYDEANDDIIIVLPIAFEGMEESATGVQFVFTR